MKTVSNHNELKGILKSGERTFLLLYKSGNPNSDCAFSNLNAVADQKELIIIGANVNSVNDIHTNYNVTSVPALLEFEKGALKNVVKGCQEKSFYSTIFKQAVIAEEGTRSNNGKQVIVYTTPTCTYCNAIKSYLAGQGISFREIDISRDEHAAREMVSRSGQQGVPQTVINGRLVVGYDKKKLDQLLEK